MSAYLTAAALFFAFLVYGLDRLGYLPKRRSLSDAVAELELRDKTIESRDKTIERMRGERNDAMTQAAELRAKTSLEPVLALVATVADVLARVADTTEGTFAKLASFNGTLDHMRDEMAANREAFELAVEGMKALTGTICELHDLPLREPNR